MKEFLEYISAENPFYRSYFKGEIVGDLSRFPVMDKKSIRENEQALFSDFAADYRITPPDGFFSVRKEENLNRTLIPEITSGSSGNPLKIYKTNGERLALALNSWRQRQRISRRVNQRNTFFLIHSHRTQEKIVDDTRNYHPDNIKKILEHLRDEMRPLCIHGTPSDLMQYVQYIQDHDFDMGDWKLDFVESNSEYLSPEQKQAIEQTFDARVINNYGALEVWNIAFECPLGHMHRSPGVHIERYDVSQNRVLRDDEPGEGELLLTSTILKAFPIIRYRIGDIGRLEHRDCACGNPNPVVHLLEARVINLLHRYQTEGKITSGVSLFKAVIWEIMCDTSIRIDRYKIKQVGADQFEVYATLRDDADWNQFCELFTRLALPRLGNVAEFQYFPVAIDSEAYAGKNYSFVNQCKA